MRAPGRPKITPATPNTLSVQPLQGMALGQSMPDLGSTELISSVLKYVQFKCVLYYYYIILNTV